MTRYWTGTSIRQTWWDRLLLRLIRRRMGFCLWIQLLEERAWAEELSDADLTRLLHR